MTIQEMNEAIEDMRKLVPFKNKDTDISFGEMMLTKKRTVCVETFIDGITVKMERQAEGKEYGDVRKCE